jgi:putative NADH-flavin reductase
MTVAVFGAGGRTGSLVLEQARRRGWPVRALVRSTGKLAGDDVLKVVHGDSRDSGAIDDVLVGPGGKVGAVLCTLGMQDITAPATDFSDSVRAIVAGMQRHGVRRIVAVASAGALDHPAGGYRSQHDLPAAYRHVGAEHVRNFETLRASGLDWTLMCPLTLVADIPAGAAALAASSASTGSTGSTGSITSSGSARWLYDDLPPGSSETGYADLARVMCDLLAERASYGKRVGIVSLRTGTR